MPSPDRCTPPSPRALPTLPTGHLDALPLLPAPPVRRGVDPGVAPRAQRPIAVLATTHATRIEWRQFVVRGRSRRRRRSGAARRRERRPTPAGHRYRSSTSCTSSGGLRSARKRVRARGDERRVLSAAAGAARLLERCLREHLPPVRRQRLLALLFPRKYLQFESAAHTAVCVRARRAGAPTRAPSSAWRMQSVPGTTADRRAGGTQVETGGGRVLLSVRERRHVNAKPAGRRRTPGWWLAKSFMSKWRNLSYLCGLSRHARSRRSMAPRLEKRSALRGVESRAVGSHERRAEQVLAHGAVVVSTRGWQYPT